MFPSDQSNRKGDMMDLSSSALLPYSRGQLAYLIFGSVGPPACRHVRDTTNADVTVGGLRLGNKDSAPQWHKDVREAMARRFEYLQIARGFCIDRLSSMSQVMLSSQP